MVDDGLFERLPIDRLFGIHNTPGTPAGQLRTRPGPVMAGEDNFTIQVRGRGGHASAPHLVVDPLVIGAEIVLALQHVVARSVDPVRAAVLSCTDLRTDGTRNAIPSNVTITGDTRSFDKEIQELLDRRIREVSHGVATAHGATVDVTYTHEFAPTVNDATCVAIAGRAAHRALGEDRVDIATEPIMASEDFGVLARSVPALPYSAMAPSTAEAAYRSTATLTSSTTRLRPPGSLTTARSSHRALLRTDPRPTDSPSTQVQGLVA